MEDRVLSIPELITDISPEEWMFRWETHGEMLSGCSRPEQLRRYKRGKAMRDWWFKETGDWGRLVDGRTLFLPEEMLEFLVPGCFYELFSRWPITALARQFYDNGYTQSDYENDMKYRAMGLDPEQGGYRVFREREGSGR